MSPPSHPDRRGFATMIAVVMLTLVSATILGLTMLFAAEARHSRRVHGDAQLRQLLLAGAVLAEAHFDELGQQPWTAPLPGQLTDRDATLTLQLQPDVGVVRVEAGLGEHTAEQTLRFVRHEDAWQLVEAHLERLR